MRLSMQCATEGEGEGEKEGKGFEYESSFCCIDVKLGARDDMQDEGTAAARTESEFA